MKGEDLSAVGAVVPTDSAEIEEDRGVRSFPSQLRAVRTVDATLYIVPCSATKSPDLRPGLLMQARDAYTGQAFRLARRQLEQSGRKWCILSARYGFLWPTTWIERYDDLMPARIHPADWEPFEAITARQYGKLRSAGRIVVLGSSRYANAAEALLGRAVEAPLAGLPIGRMLHQLSTWVEGRAA